MTIISHSYESKLFSQVDGDTVINGVTVPKGFVDVSAMAHASGKKLQDYAVTQEALDFLIALSKRRNLIQQGGLNSTPNLKGSKARKQYYEQALRLDLLIKVPDSLGSYSYYADAVLAKRIAMWASAEFAVFACEVIDEVLNDNFRPITQSAQEAQTKLSETWELLRTIGKDTRKEFVEAIHNYLMKYANHIDEDDIEFMYVNASDKLNLLIFGKKSKQLKEIKGINDDDLLRDTFTPLELKMVRHTERLATDYINLGCDPVRAIEKAWKCFNE